MPVIDLFEGLKILLYTNDHNPPHIHVNYGEFSAMVEIETLQIIHGQLPSKQYKKVVEWAMPRKSDLLIKFQILNPKLR